MPKLSVITINYNNADGLQKTIQSVLAQNFEDFEYIIIDGGSSDGSKAIIEDQADSLAYWVSEMDAGIYNAMNKGIKKATGDYLLFLNSGDYLFNDEVVKEIFAQGNEADIIYGNLVAEKEDSTRTEWILTKELSPSYFISSSLPHSSSFIKRSLFLNHGLYSEHFKIVSDWEFFFKATQKYKCSYQHVPLFASVFTLGGISTKQENIKLRLEEKLEVFKKNFPAFLLKYEQYVEAYYTSIKNQPAQQTALFRKLKNFYKKLHA